SHCASAVAWLDGSTGTDLVGRGPRPRSREFTGTGKPRFLLLLQCFWVFPLPARITLMATGSAARATRSPVSASERVVNDSCLHIPPTVFTLAGFRAWVTADDFPEGVRLTFVDTEVYLDVSKEELQYHAAVKAEICRVLMNLIRTLLLGRFYLDGILL